MRRLLLVLVLVLLLRYSADTGSPKNVRFRPGLRHSLTP